jgi:ABC-2 type transport system permease protein
VSTATTLKPAAYRVEVVKQTQRPRTPATLLVVSLTAGGICGLVGAYRGDSPERIGDWGSVLPNSTGIALALVAVNALTLLAYPVIASLYAGDSIAGESSSGSLRYLLAQPVSRWTIMSAKLGVSAALAAGTIAASAVVALAIGAAVYGIHPLSVVDLQHSTAFSLASTSLNTGDALLRYVGALGLILISTSSVFTFSLLLSTVTEYSFAAIAGGIGLVFTSRALDNIPGLNALSPWLPVTDAGTTAWTGLFDRPVQSGPIGHLVVVEAVYSAVFIAVAYGRFLRADMLA